MELKEKIYSNLRELSNALESKQLELDSWQTNTMLHHMYGMLLVLDLSLSEQARRRLRLVVMPGGAGHE